MVSHLSLESAARRVLALTALAACVMQVGMACNKQDAGGDPKIMQGKVVFMANCIACHNANPNLDGALGPAIKGSALELIQARVMHGEYPPGYSPKRPTHIMQKLPLTEENVEALHAFLNSP